MTLAALLLLSILAALLIYMLGVGSLLHEASWAVRSTAAARGSPCVALRQLAPVPVRSRPMLR